MGKVIALDIETTGLTKADRIIEFGAVVFDTDILEVVAELETLVNPLRNVPEDSTEIHGLTSSDLSLAPTFEEIADDLVNFLSGHPIVAHNADFDVKFLEREFARVGKPLSFSDVTCTYKISGQRLNVACEQIGFKFEHHSAVNDARASLALLVDHKYQTKFQNTVDPNVHLEQTFRTLTRSQVGKLPIDRRRSSLANLPVKFRNVGAEATYLGLLDAFLRDLSINSAEAFGLKEFALVNGLSENKITQLQEIYLDSIEHAALRDGIITAEEASFFNLISRALGFDRELAVSGTSVELPERGSLICVTGTATVNGVHYNKEAISALLVENNYVFTDAISKKSGVSLLLQDSPGSQSSKVTKAQAWGIPRMVIADFVELVGR
jgi:DNA polymerase-3 subunit epsilon